jgi:hypothetical protein
MELKPRSDSQLSRRLLHSGSEQNWTNAVTNESLKAAELNVSNSPVSPSPRPIPLLCPTRTVSLDPVYPPSPDSAAVFSLGQTKIGQTTYTVRNAPATSAPILDGLTLLWDSNLVDADLRSLPTSNGLDVFYLGLLLWSRNQRSCALEKFKEAAKLEPGSKLMASFYPWIESYVSMTKEIEGDFIKEERDHISLGKFIPVDACIEEISHMLHGLCVERSVFKKEVRVDRRHRYRSFNGMFLGLHTPSLVGGIVSLNSETGIASEETHMSPETPPLFTQIHLFGRDDRVQDILSKVVEHSRSRRLRSRFFSKPGEVSDWFTTYAEQLQLFDVGFVLFPDESVETFEKEKVFHTLAKHCPDVLVTIIDTPVQLFDASLRPQRITNIVQTFERGLQKKNLPNSDEFAVDDVLKLFFDLTISESPEICQEKRSSLSDWYTQLEHAGFAILESRKIVDHWLGVVYLIHASSTKSEHTLDAPLTPRAVFHQKQLSSY